jgi:AraC family transcriptional regulator
MDRSTAALKHARAPSYGEWMSAHESNRCVASLLIKTDRDLGLTVIRSRIVEAFNDAATPDMCVQLCVEGMRSGVWDAGFGRTKLRLMPGQMVVSPADRPVEIQAAGMVGFCGVAFAWGPAREALERHLQQPLPDFSGLHTRVLMDGRLRTLVLAIAEEVESGSPSGRLYTDSLMTALLARLARLPEDGAGERLRGGLSERQVETVRTYVREHIAATLTIDELAKLVHLSRFHFARSFQVSVGCSPHEFVLRERIARAQDMLRHSRGEVTIADVARAVGFCDPSHLSRHFRRVVGVSPGVWRSAR